jgi:hypothetical protein
MFGMLLLPFAGKARRRGLMACGLFFVLVAGGLVGCGNSPTPTPQPRSYTVTLTATSGTVTNSTTLTLRVQ